MIVGVGVDVVDIARFTAVLQRRPGLAGKLFTAGEAVLPAHSLAARFAAKEALAKALGAPGGLFWQDAEVVRATGGPPQLRLSGSVARRCAELGVRRTHLSLAHDGPVALAFVICEAEISATSVPVTIFRPGHIP